MRIAIVEDDLNERQRLSALTKQYFDAQGSPCQITLYSDGDELLENYQANFDRVIVVLNIGSTMEIEALKQDDGIDFTLWMGFPGSTGVMALGLILKGEVTPSGHTVDTWAVDYTKDPTWYNSGVYVSEFGNRYLFCGEKTDYAFVNSKEGIYVGYRYYETRGFKEARAGNESWCLCRGRLIY